MTGSENQDRTEGVDVSIGRRGVLAGVAATVSLAMTRAPAEPIATSTTAIVATSHGPVVGLVSEGIQTFKGLRYAAPPLGPLRFMPPREPSAWTEPASGLFYGAAAMQLASGGSAVSYPGDVGAALGQGMDSPQDILRQHEDCLFLNVWTPALGDGRKRPVMVWLHGGGFNYGSGSWPFYDGHNLAKRHDVVVVTLNHRLNIFGYLELSDLGAPGSGNAGMLDLVAALRWVRDNIAQFGGDPGNVTIFGQSGGGAKVSTLLAMPAAKGLFHRGIIESGPGLRGIPQPAAAAFARTVIKDAGAADLPALQALSADRLLAVAQMRGGGGGFGGLRWGPVVDGKTLPENPFDPVASPLGAGVPVMVGCTANEQTLYNVGQPWWGKLTDVELDEKARLVPGGKGPALVAAFRKLHPDHSPSYLYTDVTGALGAFNGSVLLAERKAAQHAAPVYLYIWEWAAPVDGGILKAPHTMEIPFAFDNIDKGPILLGSAPSTQALARLTSSTWVAFARTGDPNHPQLPHWPPYDADRRSTMIFNIDSRVVDDPNSEVRRILQS
jgi:para-nitrobenzyl esterase